MSAPFLYTSPSPQGVRGLPSTPFFSPYHHTPGTAYGVPTMAYCPSVLPGSAGQRDFSGVVGNQWAPHSYPWTPLLHTPASNPLYPPGVYIPPTPLTFQFHPFLCKRSPCIFDLSLSKFRPESPDSGRRIRDALAESATDPPIGRLVIKSSKWIPEIVLDRDIIHVSHIRLGDVLRAIHNVIQTDIELNEWVNLPNHKKDSVVRAYRDRLKLKFHWRDVPTERCKKVDYLRGKVMFGGLTWEKGYRNEAEAKLVKERPYH